MKPHYLIGEIASPAGKINVISTQWTKADILSTIKVRWSVGRMRYTVVPGIFAIGNPDENSAVFVTGNFKLSFDHVRRALQGISCWLLVLDTKGINVWCAAGKGTFGTEELIYRINEHQLDKLVTHRKIILPQLGAVGVSAHEVKSQTGFKVMYGPVRAEDISDFVNANYKATPEMRKVKFRMMDRLKLIPVEISYGKKYLLLIPAIFFILSGLNPHGYSIDAAWNDGSRAILILATAYLSGCVLTPILLPYLPFKRFSLKGLLIGWIFAALFLFLNVLGSNIIEIISYFLMMGGLSSFMAMNFTGSTTFTSLSGVQKEMKLSLPIQIIGTALGCIAWIVSRFIILT
ncbi:MAG: mercury methylation corrinoid protein HgcA [Bacteroidota bacterium]